jgi:hypothetical protein
LLLITGGFLAQAEKGQREESIKGKAERGEEKFSKIVCQPSCAKRC